MDSGHSTERGFQFILSNYIIAIFEVIKKNVAFYKKTLRQDWESVKRQFLSGSVGVHLDKDTTSIPR